MFNENSVLVKTWVSLIKEGAYTRQQVPNLSNLREMVYSTLEERKGE